MGSNKPDNCKVTRAYLYTRHKYGVSVNEPTTFLHTNSTGRHFVLLWRETNDTYD